MGTPAGHAQVPHGQGAAAPTYVTPENFVAIYRACDKARWPASQAYNAADWWRALLIVAYMTGWRISAILAMRREDLDLDAGTVLTRAEDNKGKRDEKVKLHPAVIEHRKTVPGFDSCVFPWDHGNRQLYDEFATIQTAAGICLPCQEKHEHTDFCYLYGFHDLRRAFATMNADRKTGDALQVLMRHKAYATTQRYMAPTRQLDEAVASLYVPKLSQAK